MASSSRSLWLTLLGLAAVFAVVTYFANAHQDILRSFVQNSPVVGVFIYLVLGMFDAVIAPGSTLPLVPLAGKLWGPWWGALLTIGGWTWGSTVAFFLADKFGQPVVRHLVSQKKLLAVKGYIPHNLFWGVVMVRLVLPLDVTSYAIGLFTNMRYADYIGATVIGVAPGAFLLSSLGTLPSGYEVLVYAAGIAVFAWFVRATGRLINF